MVPTRMRPSRTLALTAWKGTPAKLHAQSRITPNRYGIWTWNDAPRATSFSRSFM